jgi:hypothetical protein
MEYFPEGNKAAHFTAVATNANAPNVEKLRLTAYISLTAQKIAD